MQLFLSRFYLLLLFAFLTNTTSCDTLRTNNKDTMATKKSKSLKDDPIHLGLQATATSLTTITGGEWYEEYSKNHENDGLEGRLVSMYTFTEPWDTWEMHPHGEEVVLCTAGEMTLHQTRNVPAAAGDESDVTTVILKAGEYVVNPKGMWHTADCYAPCSAVFITPGLGTELKPRKTTKEEGAQKEEL